MSITDLHHEAARATRYERHREVEWRWAALCADLAHHEQEVDILRLQKRVLEPELVALREEFFDDGADQAK